MKLLRFILSVMALLAGWIPAASAQDFIIRNFVSSVTLSEEGWFDVRETIVADFSVSKHGIFRDIPVEYQQQAIEGERALGHGGTGSTYRTPLSDIFVDGHEFSVEDRGATIRIKIGSASKYVEGLVTYNIRYRVYGAVNQFTDRNEFYWNATGNEWPVPIEKASLILNLPKNVSLRSADYAYFTGLKGDTGKDALVSVTEKSLRVSSTRKFDAGEGLTFGLTLPKDYLKIKPIPLSVIARDYYLDAWTAEYKVHEDGTVTVTEEFDVVPVKTQVNVSRYLPQTADAALLELSNPGKGGTSYLYYELQEAKAGVSANTSDYWIPNKTDYGFSFLLSGGFVPSPTHYTLKYRVWGAVNIKGDSLTLRIQPFAESQTEPVQMKSIRIVTDQPATVRYVQGFDPVKLGAAPQGDMRKFSMEPFNNTQVKPRIWVTIPKGSVAISRIPMRMLADEFYYPEHHASMTLEPSGKVKFDHRLSYQPVNYNANIPSFSIPLEQSRWDTLTRTPDLGWLNSTNRFLLSETEFSNNFSYAFDLFGYYEVSFSNVISSFDSVTQMGLKYSLYGILGSRNGMRHLSWKIIDDKYEPVDKATLRIHLPEGAIAGARYSAWYFDMDTITGKAADLRAEGNAIVSDTFSIPPGSGVLIRADVPAEVFSTSWGLWFKLSWKNNKFIYIALIVSALMFLLWYIFGRDPRFTKMVHFYAPEDMTPSEAGLLIDDKLHNRDLLALIYYWAAKGYVRIQPVYTAQEITDFKLLKLQPLPPNSKSFERTIFNGLFKRVTDQDNSVAISSLKFTFHDKMSKARKELETYAKTKKFFVPGTRGWGIFMRVIGVFGILAAIFFLVLVLFAGREFRGAWDIPLGIGISSFAVWYAGKRMGRKTPFGMDLYKQVAGFHEFIERAEKEKLEKLVHEDASYFEHTLSFAIAFGIAEKWTKKFEGLLATPPSWYGDGRQDDKETYLERMRYFDAERLNRQLQQALNAMSSSLNSAPPSSSGGGGGSSYSSGGSSWSSSGSSGGSYRSSGGYSGGGYGGGGGGSW